MSRRKIPDELRVFEQYSNLTAEQRAAFRLMVQGAEFKNAERERVVRKKTAPLPIANRVTKGEDNAASLG